jgi:glucuronate isomerase
MYPTFIRRMIEERLDVCPLNKVSAFFSDAYMAEWSYGKWQLVQRELAHALAARVASGYLTRNDASAVIRMWTWDNPVRLLRLDAAQR